MKTKILKTFLSLCVIFGLATAAHAQNLYVSVNGDFSNTGGSISEYTPDGTQTTFASKLASPRGLAFDSSGNLFLGQTKRNNGEAFHAMVLKFPPQGHQSVLGNAALAVAEGVATDGAGNVYALVQELRFEAITIYKFAPDGTRTVFGSLPAVQGFDIAFDSTGNLFAADASNATIWKFTPDGTRTVFVGPEAFAPETSPIGLAFDSAGNLFVSTEGSPGSDSVLVFTPDGMESTFATGLTQPRGLAFDASGNLFVAETRPAPLGDIVEFPTGGGEIVFATGIDRPEFVTFGPPR